MGICCSRSARAKKSRRRQSIDPRTSGDGHGEVPPQATSPRKRRQSPIAVRRGGGNALSNKRDTARALRKRVTAPKSPDSTAVGPSGVISSGKRDTPPASRKPVTAPKSPDSTAVGPSSVISSGKRDTARASRKPVTARKSLNSTAVGPGGVISSDKRNTARASRKRVSAPKSPASTAVGPGGVISSGKRDTARKRVTAPKSPASTAVGPGGVISSDRHDGRGGGGGPGGVGGGGEFSEGQSGAGDLDVYGMNRGKEGGGRRTHRPKHGAVRRHDGAPDGDDDEKNRENPQDDTSHASRLRSGAHPSSDNHGTARDSPSDEEQNRDNPQDDTLRASRFGSASRPPGDNRSTSPRDSPSDDDNDEETPAGPLGRGISEFQQSVSNIPHTAEGLAPPSTNTPPRCPPVSVESRRGSEQTIPPERAITTPVDTAARPSPSVGSLGQFVPVSGRVEFTTAPVSPAVTSPVTPPTPGTAVGLGEGRYQRHSAGLRRHRGWPSTTGDPLSSTPLAEPSVTRRVGTSASENITTAGHTSDVENLASGGKAADYIIDSERDGPSYGTSDPSQV